MMILAIGTTADPLEERRPVSLAPGLLIAVLLCASGCRSKAPVVDDASLSTNIQNQLTADNAISGQPILTAVSGGVATLSGSVQNDAQRTLAARDAAGVAGVREVVNNLSVSALPPSTASATAAPRAPLPTPLPKSNSKVKPSPEPRIPAPIERPQQDAFNPPPPEPPPAPVQPPPPPAPTLKTLAVPAGETLSVRITQTLDSGTTQEGTTFSGVVASDVMIDGLIAIPAGAAVSGHVDAVQEAAHYKGASLLTVSLSSLTRHGEHIPITTDPYTVQGKGRGTNTAEKVGGGAAVGAILGGIFGGGKGAAIGAAAGGGAGAGVNTVTRGQQVQIASESVVRFKLQTPIAVKVRSDGGDDRGDGPAKLHVPDPQPPQ